MVYYYIVLQASINNIKSLAKFAMMTDSFGFKHKSGMLTAVSSLPSEWGIGTFGAPCKRFVDFLSATRTKCWQILPLNPTAYGDSPYQSPASFAGNHYYIDPQTLFEKGLLDGEDLKSAVHVCDRTDYGWLFENKTALLKKHIRAFCPIASSKRFAKTTQSGLTIMRILWHSKPHSATRRGTNGKTNSAFTTRRKHAKGSLPPKLHFGSSFSTSFCRVAGRFKLRSFKGYNDCRRYAHLRRIRFRRRVEQSVYVLLDEDLNPTVVAGCPPDAYAEDGQLWGNPIYDYDKMKADGYEWWIERIEQSFKLYDILRIDHFRGFAGYFVIKNGEKPQKTASGWSAPANPFSTR